MLLTVLGVCLILLSGAYSSNDEENIKEADYYTNILEEKIEELLLQMSEIENVSVLITLENSGETIYAENISLNSSEYVIYSSDKNQQGLILAEITPQVRGIAIICTNGDNIKIQSKIISILSSALGIPSNKITVCG